MMDIQELKSKNCLIFECISGSKAYGLDTKDSDVDIRGVFIAPREDYYSFTYQDQINDERSNIIYYELKKFLELLAKNNPSMIELLNIPEDCILYKHPLYDKIKAEHFLSLLCKDTFLGYATSQFKKAYGLNKKILNPIDKTHKNPLDFCYVLDGHQSTPLSNFLKERGLLQENCGLVAIPHMRDLYSVFYSPDKMYNGILHSNRSMEVSLSSVPKGQAPIASLSFNKDGYSTYCKDYKEYWDWVEHRNQDRYQNTVESGKNYDAKNMMHLFRLLLLSEEIGRSEKIVLRSSERDFLLRIKKGGFSYDELSQMMTSKVQEIDKVYETSRLQKKPDLLLINNLLIDIRTSFYDNP